MPEAHETRRIVLRGIGLPPVRVGPWLLFDGCFSTEGTTAMAGDWIKVEKSTARKPEVLRIAELLEIHPDQAFGLCFRFWCWCDDHFENANASGVSKLTVDTLLDRSGFVDALIVVGWLQVRQGSLVIPNYDRHLSQSAKSRALTAARVAKHTSRNTNARLTRTPLAREEKRREEKSNQNTHPPPEEKFQFIPTGGNGISTIPLVPIPEILDGPEFRPTWERWLTHLCDKGRRPTLVQLQDQLAKFAKRGVGWTIERLNDCISNGTTIPFYDEGRSAQPNGKKQLVSDEEFRKKCLGET